MRLLIVAVLFIQSLLFSQQLIDGVAAVVDDDIVLYSDIEQAVMSYAYQNHVDLSSNPGEIKKLRRDFFKQMLERKLLLVKAKQDTIEIDDERVQQAADRQYNNILRQVGSEKRLVQMYNMPLSRIRRFIKKNIREQMLVEQVHGDIVNRVKITRKEVEAFYRANQDSIPELPETVELGHILRNIKPSESALSKAKQKADSLYQLLRDGEDFSLLAQKYSQDPGSRANGGDLGFTEKGQFVPPFEEAAYKLKVNEISKPVLSDFGYHIIQLLAKNGDRIHTRHILIMVKPTDDDLKRTFEFLEEIRRKILSDSISFSDAALKYSEDPNVKSDKGILGVFEKNNISVPEFKEVVMLLKPGEISHPFRTRFGAHILKLFSYEPSRKLSLEKDYEKIKSFALQQKRDKEFKRVIENLKKEVPIKVYFQE
jgi:peptidyl-prolyl cis-trans isomerase SurA